MCAEMARGVGCSKASIGEKLIVVAVRRREASSVAASESTPASSSGMSRLSVLLSAPPRSPTVLRTRGSTSARDTCGASTALSSSSSSSVSSSDSWSSLSIVGFSANIASSLRSGGECKETIDSNTAVGTGSCTAKASRGAILSWRLAAKSSKDSPSPPSPRVALDDMPEPSMSGSCMLRAVAACARRERASASR